MITKVTVTYNDPEKGPISLWVTVQTLEDLFNEANQKLGRPFNKATERTKLAADEKST